MDINEFIGTASVTFLAGILGIAYPILLEVISKLDEKYSSIIITDLFQREQISDAFKGCLKLTLWSLLFWVLIKLFAPDTTWLYKTLGDFLFLFIVLSTASTVIFFLRLVAKMFTYYTSYKFFKYLEKQHIKFLQRNDFEFFRAMSDVLNISIRRNNEDLAREISRFIYHCFSEFRKTTQTGPIQYPNAYYRAMYSAQKELVQQNSPGMEGIVSSVSGGHWLYDSLENSHFSEQSYSWMWSILRLAETYKRDGFVMENWRYASQHIETGLGYIMFQHDQETFDITNNEEVEERNKQRERFFEFYFVLGGLTLYNTKYALLKRMLNYTSSEPPHYPLLPNGMEQIFVFYFKIIDPFYLNKTELDLRYDFPSAEGIGAGHIINLWVTRYLALLFIWLYVRHQYTILKHVAIPDAPNKAFTRQTWLQYLPFFKAQVEWVLNNKQLIEELNWGAFNDSWCRENDKPTPNEFFDQFTKRLKAYYPEKEDIKE